MIDPILSLSFSIHSNPGVYALLLGSGVSRSAGIPTGWEVVLDLIRKLARLTGEDCEPDPALWFKEKFGREPEYSKLLYDISKSSAERQQFHKSYFEPTEEEREHGLKLPTSAHKAIAELISKGYVKVIITTNFDRLLEKAIEEGGVMPVVISTPDGVDGAIPLIHSKLTIIKVNGDYLDARLKITEDELSEYDERINRLLDRILDEFGLIVSGWSAKWDIALRGALERCKNHRFTTYWSVKDEIDDTSKKLVGLRCAQIISIKNADYFFSELAEKVSALEELSKPHPLSVKMAAASLKKYIVDGRYIINLHDLITSETEKLYLELNDKNFPVQGIAFSAVELVKRVQKYEALSEILLALTMNGCYWGDERHQNLWLKCLERIANHAGERNGLTVWLNLRLYPALLLLYGGGIASIAAEKYDTFSTLLSKVKIRDGSQEELAIFHLNATNVMERSVGQQFLGMERHYTPLSEHLYDHLRIFLKESLPDDFHYQKCFDKFEYLLALVYADLRGEENGKFWGPIGCFGWRYRHSDNRSVMNEIEREIEKGYRPIIETLIGAGFFNVSMERFKQVKKSYDELLTKLHWS